MSNQVASLLGLRLGNGSGIIYTRTYVHRPYVHTHTHVVCGNHSTLGALAARNAQIVQMGRQFNIYFGGVHRNM